MFSRFQSFPSGRVGGPVLAALFLAALVYPGMPCSGEESPDAPGNMEVHERHVTLTPDQRMQTGVAGFREKIDAGGRIVQRMFADADGNPCLDRNGVAGWKIEYNERGQQVRITNLAPDGKSLMVSREGVAEIQNTFDSRGYLVRCRFFGVDGQPCYATNGVAGWEADYDQRGFQTRNAYHAGDLRVIEPAVLAVQNKKVQIGRFEQDRHICESDFRNHYTSFIFHLLHHPAK